MLKEFLLEKLSIYHFFGFKMITIYLLFMEFGVKQNEVSIIR
jgi:hypothetical protein